MVMAIFQAAPAELTMRLRELPTNRVVRLVGVDRDRVTMALAGAGALPSPVTLLAPIVNDARAVVHDVLVDMESAAFAIFPAWLPAAAAITGTRGAGMAAVRAVAAQHAVGTPHFTPFLADLAVAAMSGTRLPADRHSARVRAAGLARVLANGFGRPGLTLVIEVPAGLHVGQEQALVAGCEWLADRSQVGVWLTGEPLKGVDWLPVVELSAPTRDQPTVASPPGSTIIGSPHPRSITEAMLEAALAPHAWAAGRAWNQVYQPHPLARLMCLDLLWPAERCVVEIDGPEHCQPLRFEADRQRDVMLQLAGYAVLRFTSARVQYDVGSVVHQIDTFLATRRHPSPERNHG